MIALLLARGRGGLVFARRGLRAVLWPMVVASSLVSLFRAARFTAPYAADDRRYLYSTLETTNFTASSSSSSNSQYIVMSNKSDDYSNSVLVGREEVQGEVKERDMVSLVTTNDIVNTNNTFTEA